MSKIKEDAAVLERHINDLKDVIEENAILKIQVINEREWKNKFQFIATNALNLAETLAKRIQEIENEYDINIDTNTAHNVAMGILTLAETAGLSMESIMEDAKNEMEKEN